MALTILSLFLQPVHGQTRIIGGSPVPSNSPYYPSYGIGVPLSCGSVLIHTDMALTVAHCATFFANRDLYLGGLSLSGSDAVEVHLVQQEIPFPGHSFDTDQGDIMLLKLATPSNLPVATWNTDPNLPLDDALVTAIGFGATEVADESEVLLQVDVNVIPTDTCNRPTSYDGRVSENDMVCAAAPNRDSCFGDSGGPLYLQNTIVGLVSWGIGCALPSFPGVYTRVSYYDTWIRQTVCQHSNFPPSYCDNLVATLAPIDAPQCRDCTALFVLTGTRYRYHWLFGGCVEVCLLPGLVTNLLSWLFGLQCGDC